MKQECLPLGGGVNLRQGSFILSATEVDQTISMPGLTAANYLGCVIAETVRGDVDSHITQIRTANNSFRIVRNAATSFENLPCTVYWLE